MAYYFLYGGCVGVVGILASVMYCRSKKRQMRCASKPPSAATATVIPADAADLPTGAADLDSGAGR
jgi:hypothetical protein